MTPPRPLPALVRTVLLLPLLCLCAALAAPAAPAAAKPKPMPAPLPVDVSRLPAHPRLLATAADWAALSARRAADPELDAYAASLVALAREELGRPRLERTMQGRRLLFVSRQLIHSVLLCSFAHRVTGEQAFLERARRDLLDAAAFSDWNPSHFLDVAEMSAGMALGYDWLFDRLGAEERATLRRALVEKGLRLVEKGHSTFLNTNNWAQVCGGGLALAALAVAEDEPALAAAVLGHVKAGVSRPLGVYAPDGTYPEGPSYWGYGTLYQVVMVAALRSALGEDWGILASPGFLRSAEFESQCTGPTGLFFNFADSGPRDGINEPLCYLARELGQPRLAWNTRRLLPSVRRKGEARPDRFGPLVVFWWPFAPGWEKAAEPARFFSGRGTNPVAIWRSSWTDTQGRYLAVKAGGSGVSHGHMDGGSFVLDWRGRRWASDLGMQEYNPLEQRGIKLWDMGQESQRWGIFRLGSTAHNTLTLDGARHLAKGLARLVRADEQGAEIDLAPVLSAEAGFSALRRVRVETSEIALEDELGGLKAGQCIRWAMTTSAAVRLVGQRVLLRQEGQEMRLRIEGERVAAAVEEIEAPRQDFDAANPGMRQLVLRFKAGPDGRAALKVVFEAGE